MSSSRADGIRWFARFAAPSRPTRNGLDGPLDTAQAGATCSRGMNRTAATIGRSMGVHSIGCDDGDDGGGDDGIGAPV
jgi:hypothetical protein